MFNFDQYIDIFLDESREHLQNLNDCLLRIEDNPDDNETVNEIFRIAHTLKGMSGTMGFTNMQKLTHKMENVLDGIRSQKIKVTRDLIDSLFEGLDILDAQVKNIESEGKEKEMDTSDLISRLEAAEKGEDLSSQTYDYIQSETQQTVSEPANTVTTSTGGLPLNMSEADKHALLTSLTESKKSGYQIYKADIYIDDECMLKSARAFIVYKNVEEIGEVVYSFPSSDELEKETFQGKFSLLVLSQEPMDELRSVIENVSEIERVDIAPYEPGLLKEAAQDAGSCTGLPLNMSEADKEALFTSLTESEKDGSKVYKADVFINENCMLKSARAFMVYEKAGDAGEIVYSFPPSDELEKETFEGKFSLLILSKENPDRIKSLMENVLEVDRVDVVSYDLSLLKKSTKGNASQEVSKEKAVSAESSQKSKPVGQKLAPGIVKQAAASPKKTEARQSRGSKTIRVDTDRLDNLMNLVSELIIVKTRLEDDEIFTKRQNMTDAIEYLERVTTNLHDAVTKVRMVPIERVFNRFPRVVRDLSKDLKKEIDLIMEGEETEVDRTVIDEIGDPLIHLLRNSADHGIEEPAQRIAKGKNEKGTIRLIAFQDGNTVVIEVTDDGAGINVEKVKEKAIERGILTKEQADELDTSKAAELIFAAGFSTADHVSNVSGRGVGLDVVKNKIETLNGTVEVKTEKDKGSAFVIRLPLTLAIIQALLVIVGNEKYAIPLNNIKEITDINSEDIRNIEGKEIILYRGVPLELKRMSEVLETENSQRKEGVLTAVIVRKGDKDLGLIVDSLIGQQEIVIKSLGPYLHFVRLIAGATILGNGGVALIIDTNEIFN